MHTHVLDFHNAIKVYFLVRLGSCIRITGIRLVTGFSAEQLPPRPPWGPGQVLAPVHAHGAVGQEKAEGGL